MATVGNDVRQRPCPNTGCGRLLAYSADAESVRCPHCKCVFKRRSKPINGRPIVTPPVITSPKGSHGTAITVLAVILIAVACVGGTVALHAGRASNAPPATTDAAGITDTPRVAGAADDLPSEVGPLVLNNLAKNMGNKDAQKAWLALKGKKVCCELMVKEVDTDKVMHDGVSKRPYHLRFASYPDNPGWDDRLQRDYLKVGKEITSLQVLDLKVGEVIILQGKVFNVGIEDLSSDRPLPWLMLTDVKTVR